MRKRQKNELEVYGENILKSRKKCPGGLVFLGQFKDLFKLCSLLALPGYPWSQGIRKVRWLSFPSPFFKCYFREHPASEKPGKSPGKFKTSGSFARYIVLPGRTDSVQCPSFQGSSRRYPGSGNRGMAAQTGVFSRQLVLPAMKAPLQEKL